MDSIMALSQKISFDPKDFLATIDGGRTVSDYRKNQIIFSQGDPADSVFYIQKGKVKIAVTSKQGKEAVVAIPGTEEFFGEGCLVAQPLRLATAKAITESTVMRVEKAEMIRVLHAEPTFAEVFTAHLLTATAELKRIWSINCLIQAKSALHGHFFSWRILARKVSQNQSRQRLARRPLRR